MHILRNKSLLFLVILIVVHLAFNLIFLNLNKAPVPWDQANHTRLALLIKDCVQTGNQNCLKISYYYPPFTHFAVAVLMLVFGNSMFLAQFSGTIFFTFCIIGIFLYLKELTRESDKSLLATSIFSLFPIIFYSSRFFWLEIPLLMNTAFSLYFLHKSEKFTNIKYTLLSLMFAAFATMTKWYAPVYLFVPYLIQLTNAFKEPKHVKKIIVNLTLGISVFLSITLPWYVTNLNDLIKGATYYVQADASQPTSLFSAKAIFWYLDSALKNQFGTIPFILGVIALGYFLKTDKNTSLKRYLMVQLSFIYIFFTLLGNKDLRFTLMFIPYFAYFMSYLIIELKNKWMKLFFSSVIFGYFLFFLVNFTFGWPIRDEYKLAVNVPFFGWVNIINLTNYPIERPNCNNYPLNKIVEDINKLSEKNPKKVLVIFDYPHLNSTNLITQQLLDNKNNKRLTHIESVFLPNGLKDKQELLSYMNTFDYALVTKYETAIGYFRFKDSLDKIQEEFLNGRYEQVKAYNIPLEDIEKYLSLYNDSNIENKRRDICKVTKDCSEIVLYKIK